MRDRVFCFSLVLPLTLIAFLLSIIINPKEPMYAPEVLTLEEDLSIEEPEGSEEYTLKDTPMVCKGSALYTLEEDEDGYQSVKRYRMTWGFER